MKNFSTHYWKLSAYSLFFFVHAPSDAQKILRITIAHKDTGYTWQDETINDLQATIESIAPTLLEAKSLVIEHKCEGNRVIFDINQHETRYIGEKFNSLLNGIKKITAIISRFLGNTVAQVMNIPHDVFIYYNPPTEVLAPNVENSQDISVNIPESIDSVPTTIDNINELIPTMPDNITPASNDLATETLSNSLDTVDSQEPQISEPYNSSIFEPTDNTTTELITPTVLDSDILDVNNGINDPISATAQIIEPIITPELADTNN